MELAANLGFFYAAGLVASDTLDGRVLANRTTAVDSSWTDHCRAQLESSCGESSRIDGRQHPALPKPGHAPHPEEVPAFEAWVQYSEELRNRASAIDQVAAGASAMPVEFQMFANESSAAAQETMPGPTPGLTPLSPPTHDVRIAGTVHAANLLSSPAPEYPPLALQAGVEGVVSFQVHIGYDGKITTLQLLSGPPLLVEAATAAVQQWTWKPTLVNGAPAGVLTTVEVPFTLPAR